LSHLNWTAPFNLLSLRYILYYHLTHDEDIQQISFHQDFPIKIFTAFIIHSILIKHPPTLLFSVVSRIWRFTYCNITEIRKN
jgi:hypothetical protein